VSGFIRQGLSRRRRRLDISRCWCGRDAAAAAAATCLSHRRRTELMVSWAVTWFCLVRRSSAERRRLTDELWWAAAWYERVTLNSD